MTTTRLSICIGAIAGALLCVANAAWAQSETIATPKPKPKPAAAAPKRPPATARNANDYWSINYAAPTRYEAGRITSRETTTLSGELGRVPVETGRSSVGFENTSKMSQSVGGGADPYTRKESSFVGLSLNVKNDSKALALPLLPPPPQ